jgi:hypothetical protein
MCLKTVKQFTNWNREYIIIITGGPRARLAWAGARARRLWALKAKYTSTGGEATGEGARGTGTSACYLDFVSCPGLSNFLGPPLIIIITDPKRYN